MKRETKIERLNKMSRELERVRMERTGEREKKVDRGKIRRGKEPGALEDREERGGGGEGGRESSMKTQS